MRLVVLASMLTAHLCVGVPAQELARSPLLLNSSVDVSTDGTLDLSWSGGAVDAASWELEESVVGGGPPAILDAGAHRASARSGLADGSYVFRVRAVGRDGVYGAWSDSVSVEVQHHPLGLAFAFFGVGAFVFLATVVLVVGGHRSAREED